MFEEKLKKELIKKICEYGMNIFRRDDIEKDNGLTEDDYGPKWEALLENNEEYRNLTEKAIELSDEINLMLLETKYFPIIGLSDRQEQILSIFASPSTKIDEKSVEKYLDILLLKLKDDIKERLENIKSLHLTINIDPRTCHFYNEVIRCYSYGAFEASCILCRAIVEVIAKRFIEYKGYGDLLTGKEVQLKKLTVPGILTEKLSVQKEVIEIYTRIARKADTILHAKSEKTEEKDALESIKLLQSFIEKFPRTL